MDSSLARLKKLGRIKKALIQEGTIIAKRIPDDGVESKYHGWIVDIKINEECTLYDVPYFGGTINIDTENYNDFYGLFIPPKIRSKVLIVWEKGNMFAPYVLQTYPFAWRVDRDEQVASNFSAQYFEEMFERLNREGELDDIFVSNLKGNRFNLKANGDVEVSVKSLERTDTVGEGTDIQQIPVWKKSLIEIKNDTGNILINTGKIIEDNGDVKNQIEIINDDGEGNQLLKIIINKGDDNNEITFEQKGSDGSFSIKRTGTDANGEIIEMGEEYAKVKLTDDVKLEMSSSTGSENVKVQTSDSYKIEIDEASSKVKINGGGAGKNSARKGDEVISNSQIHAMFWSFMSVLKSHDHPFVPSTQTVSPNVSLSTGFASLIDLKSEINEGSGTVQVGD